MTRDDPRHRDVGWMDGEVVRLLARLDELISAWRNRVEDGSDAATWYMAADELERAVLDAKRGG